MGCADFFVEQTYDFLLFDILEQEKKKVFNEIERMSKIRLLVF